MSQVTERRSGQFFEAHVSHPGAVRTENEDSFMARGGEGFWVVADGMGGLDDGQMASSTVARALAEAPLSGDLERDTATVAEVIRHANYLIFKESADRQTHIGSTVVSLLIRGPRFATVWAGDSRLYLRRGGTLSQVSIDHTQVQQLVDAGYLTRREAADHPMSHVLARAVGTHAEVETQAIVGEVAAGDLFLICSDGLSRVLEDDEIAREMESGNPVAMVERLLALSLQRGAPDNVTVMAIGCADPNGAMGAAMAATAPIFGGAAAEEATPAQPSKPESGPAPKPADAPAPRKVGGAAAALGLFIAALVLVGLGVGGWLLWPKLRHSTAAPPATVVVQSMAPSVDLHPFEAALGGVDCSWLEIQKIASGPAGVEMTITGVAASAPAVQSALQAAATSAKVQVADIDLQSIAPTPPALCSTLDALRPFRAATSQTGQDLTAAQDTFAVMKQADGKLAGRAIVTATPPTQGDFALAELGPGGDLSVLASDRQAFQTLAAAGTLVSTAPNAGGYRVQADYPKPGWSSLILIAGQGPFPHALLTQPAGQRNAGWASQFAAAARAGGWRVEMTWYNIVSGLPLSVIPETQAASTNALTPATNAMAPGKSLPPKKPAEATNATVIAPPSKPASPTNAAAPKSDIPL
jgi:serine/threonine protein phosphatase Stp1